jgi:copper chaperone CopZ
MAKQMLKVNGMSCEHCVAAVTKAAKDVPGVRCVKVDLAAATASFQSDDAALAQVKAAITEAGFEVA